MKKLTIEIYGEDNDDLAIAMDVIESMVDEGYVTGANSNETGRFTFNLEETPDEEDE